MIEPGGKAAVEPDVAEYPATASNISSIALIGLAAVCDGPRCPSAASASQLGWLVIRRPAGRSGGPHSCDRSDHAAPPRFRR